MLFYVFGIPKNVEVAFVDAAKIEERFYVAL
jgi:hypothetical protein